MRDTPWPDIKKSFLYGACNNEGKIVFPTLAELASQYGLSYSALTHRASVEHWTRLRREAQDRIVQAAAEMYESEMAALLGHIDKQVARASSSLADIVMEHIEAAETPQERYALVTKYAKLLPELLDASHQAIGIERVLFRAYGRIEDSERREKS